MTNELEPCPTGGGMVLRTLRAGRLRARPATWLGLVAAAGAVAVWVIHASGLLGPEAVAAGTWEAVQVQPLTQAIVAEGPMLAASAASVAAPFDGRILRRWVQAGDRVSAGAPLLRLDAGSVQGELREARIAQIRARQALAEVLDWTSGAEVATARRQLAAACSHVQALQGRHAETRALFGQGIVARAEVESAQADVDSAKQQCDEAEVGLASALRKGGAEQVRVAELEAEMRNARVRLLQERLTRATLMAPQAGVVLAPMAEATPQGSQSKEFDVGSSVAAGEVLMTIGDTSRILVRAQLDELDAMRVEPGQAAQVSVGSDKPLVLHGELVRVSAQARREAASGGGPPMFDIQVLVREVPAALRRSLRLGLTARLRMDAGPQTAVLSIPMAAVRLDGEGRAHVLRASARGGPGRDVVIEPGPTQHDRVIVRQGLAAGDVVWVPGGQAPDPADTDKGRTAGDRAGSAWPFSVGAQP